MKGLFNNKKILLGNISVIILNILIIGYIFILMGGIAFSFTSFLAEGVMFADDSLQRRRYMALLVNVLIIIFCIILRFLAKKMIKTEKAKNGIPDSFKKRIISNILSLVPAIILIGFIAYSADDTDKYGQKVDLPPQNVSVAMAVAEIRPDILQKDLFKVEIMIRCKENKDYIFTRRAEINIYYDNGVPKIKKAEIDKGFTSGKKAINWKNCMHRDGMPSVADFHISIPKDSVKYNFFGRFRQENLVIRTELFNFLPFMSLYNSENYRYIWQSDYLYDTFEIPAECFVYAEEYGKYTHIDQRRFFDFKHLNNIRNISPSGERKMVKGSVVCVKAGADDYNGTKLFDYVYDRQYRISQIDGDRAVIVYDGETVAAMNTADLYFATEIQ